jgi:cell division transport system permease protein
MNEPRQQESHGRERPAVLGGSAQRSTEAPIVPKSTIGGRALVAVVAIMTFLASLTIGAVMMVRAAAGDWQSEVAREVTIQVRAMPGRNVEADVARAVAIARAASGVADVRPYSKEESVRLLEPWLGSGLSLDDLPVPRIIVVRLAPQGSADLNRLRSALADAVPTASLDDHRGFIERMRTMARTVVVAGLAVLALVLVATILSVMFATRGAMATNRPLIEVLHFIGAKDGFIARHIQRHFLMLGLQGGLIGSGCAILLFAGVDLSNRWLARTAAGAEFTALFGMFSLGWQGYALVLVQALLVGLVTALASRLTVKRTLATIS